MKEKFRDVSGYEGLYQVSDQGRVKSLERWVVNGKSKRRVEEKNKNNLLINSGYLTVLLSEAGKNKRFLIHRLMGFTFLKDTYKEGLVIDHIDNNKLNNNIFNLQWITPRLNASKDRKNGTSKYTGVRLCRSSGKYRSTIKINGKAKHLGMFINEFDARDAYQQSLNNL